jgi:hypothetical protein
MFLIKYATRGRADWFRRAITNITNTSSSLDYRILVSADIDDPQMKNDHIIEFCRAHEKVTLIHGESKSKIDAINRDMEFAGDWDVLVNMSDDMHFILRGWDNVIRQRVSETWGTSTDFFAHFNDGYAKDALPTMSIIGREYYNRDGYIYHPDYRSFSCDAEAMYVAMMRGRHKYFSDSIFLHQHPTNTPVKNDKTYQVNSLHTPHDTAVYFERLKRYFDEPSGHDILRTRPELKPYL